MIVTGMLVAEIIRPAEGKIDVLGGVIERWTTPDVGTGNPTTIPLLVLTQSSPEDDENATMTIELRDPSGEIVGTVDARYQLPKGSESGYLAVVVPAVFTVAGRHTFHAVAGGSEFGAALPLNIIAANRDQSP